MSIVDRYTEMFQNVLPDNLKAQLKTKKGTLQDGAINVVLASIVVSFMMLVAMGLQMLLLGSISMVGDPSLDSAFGAGMGFAGAIAIAIVIPILSLVLSLVTTSVMWALARVLGGVGTYSDQFFQFSLPMGGLMMISALIGIIPCLGDIASFVLFFYSFYVAFLVYKSVHKLNDSRAIILVLLPIILIGILAILAVVLVAGFLTAAVSSVSTTPTAYYS